MPTNQQLFNFMFHRPYCRCGGDYVVIYINGRYYNYVCNICYRSGGYTIIKEENANKK